MAGGGGGFYGRRVRRESVGASEALRREYVFLTTFKVWAWEVDGEGGLRIGRGFGEDSARVRVFNLDLDL